MRLCVCVAGLAVGVGAGAQDEIIFNGFSDTTGLAINADASVASTSDGDVLRLTRARSGESGSAFSQEQVDASNFSTFFQFRISDPGGSVFDNNDEPGADGLVFVVQPISNSLGTGGQGIGYAGIGTSIGVEFDTWGNNANNDPSQSHVGIIRDGSVQHDAGANTGLPTANVTGPELDDGDLWSAWIDYDGANLEVRLSLTDTRPIQALLSAELDLIDIMGQDTAFVGFTSGTGAAWANHDIVNWRYTRFVPAPATGVLMASGLVVAAGRRRRA